MMKIASGTAANFKNFFVDLAEDTRISFLKRNHPEASFARLGMILFTSFKT